MGLFNFLKTKSKPIPEDIPLPAKTEGCDSTKTNLVAELFKIPANQRDEQWQEEFYQHVLTAGFQPGTPQVFTGPDGFPYFVLQTPAAGSVPGSICIQNIKNDLLMKGYGIVFNPQGENADWVFSYGDIVNLCLNNEFISKTANTGTQHIDMTKSVGVIKKDDKILVAQPSAAYLPVPTRTALKKFLQNKGVRVPKVMLLCTNSEDKIEQKLAFNVHPEDFASTAKQDHRMQEIGWFLPKHYIIVCLPKKASLTRSLDNL